MKIQNIYNFSSIHYLNKSLQKFESFIDFHHNIKWGRPLGVMVNALYCGMVVSEFELQLRYYVWFRTNALGKGMDPLILSTMG